MEKKNKYLIACSGGPDSMALLNMSKDKYEVYVAHVNYHKRKTAKRDELIVKEYCDKYNIPFFKKDVYPRNVKGNFQSYARDARYAFFKKICDEYNLDGVLVAHHLDDLLETYEMQKEKHLDVECFGLSKNNTIKKVNVIRPLLNYQKSYLLNYCLKNNIPFGIDESNLESHYTRNKVRHSKIEKMSYKEKQTLLNEVKLKNKQKQIEKKEIKKFIKEKYSEEEFFNFKYLKNLLRELIDNKLSDKYLDEIIKALKAKNNIELKVKNKYIAREYGYIEIYDIEKEYSYTIKRLTNKTYKHFKIANKGTSFEGVTVAKEDFPLTIRSYKENDAIEMLYGTKKINRFFIDKKIARKERRIWPIVLNSAGTAILVPGLGCDKRHYSTKHNLFVVKLK